jgi:adenylate cyclase
MRARSKGFLIWLVPLVLLAAGVGLIASDLGGIASRARNFQFDTYQRLKPRAYVETAGYPVRVVDIDDVSLAKYGAWPWPDSVLTKIVDAFKAQGAAIVVLDMPLAASSPASSAQAIAPSSVAQTVGHAALYTISVPEETLATAVAGIKTVTGFTLARKKAQKPNLKTSIDAAPELFFLIPSFQGSADSDADVEAASAGVGVLNFRVDADGVLRSKPLFFRLKG